MHRHILVMAPVRSLKGPFYDSGDEDTEVEPISKPTSSFDRTNSQLSVELPVFSYAERSKYSAWHPKPLAPSQTSESALEIFQVSPLSRNRFPPKTYGTKRQSKRAKLPPMRIEEEDDDDDVFRDTNYDELLAGSEFSGGEDPLPAKRSKNSKGKQKEVATLGGEREDDTPRASVARMRTRASGKNGNMKEKPTPRIPSSTSKPHRHQETNDGEGKIASRLRKPIETPAKRSLRRLQQKRAGISISSQSEGPDSDSGFVVEDPEEPIDSPPPPHKRRRSSSHKKRNGKQENHPDPDDSSSHMAETSDEDMVEAIKLDDPERFKATSRLRHTRLETAQQRRIRKLRNKRLGIKDDSSGSSGEEDAWENDGEDEPIYVSSGDNNDDYGNVQEDDVAEEDISNFIVDDGSQPLAEDLLPPEFSRNALQSTEYKFRVVFHYFLLLAMKGAKHVLPLDKKTREYFGPPLADLRRRMKDYQNNRVRSQVWSRELVQILEKYPCFRTEYTGAEMGCDACNISGRIGTITVTIGGEPYDKETFQTLQDTDDEGKDEDSDVVSVFSEEKDSSDIDGDESAPQIVHSKLVMGKICKARTQAYHQLFHWEYTLYHRIRRYYKNLLRAAGDIPSVISGSEIEQTEDEIDQAKSNTRSRRKSQRKEREAERKVKSLRQQGMPDDLEELDDVMEWMEEKADYVTEEFEWMEQLVENAERLDREKATD
ncbi:hypothetical protein C368_01962 [Cryptococcus neoformans 125.91]|nr:hypothetical protein C368_01962 [Cryptococcus neoformans var. grubii 125.91]